MKVVPQKLAKACMENFDLIMQGESLPIIKDAFSSSITFDTPGLAQWLESNNYLKNTQSIRFSFGIYTLEAAIELGIPQLAGRLTAFIWPIQDGKELDPGNMGELTP